MVKYQKISLSDGRTLWGCYIERPNRGFMAVFATQAEARQFCKYENEEV